MKYVSARDFRTYPKINHDEHQEIQDMIVNNISKPITLLTPLSGTNFENTLKAVRQANAKIGVDKLRETSLRRKNNKLFRKDINRSANDVRIIK